MVYIAVQIFQTPKVVYSVEIAWTVGCGIGFRFALAAYLLFAEGPFPDHWRRFSDEVHAKADVGGSDVLPPNLPLTKKLWWMIDIVYNLRMIGWVQEPRNHLPPHPPPSRLTFLKKTFPKFIINNTIADLAISVAGFSSPTQWPDIWGNWRDACTVRKVWGYEHSPFFYCVFRRPHAD